MIRRITAAALCAGVLGGAAGTAEAAFKAGTYKGKTEQGAGISLKVVKSKKAVIKFSWEGVVMDCSDGERRPLAGLTSPASEKFPLSKAGKFGFTAGTPDGALRFKVDGKVKNAKAKGGLQVVVTIDPEQNTLDPNGSVTCDSRRLSWSAKRK